MVCWGTIEVALIREVMDLVSVPVREGIDAIVPALNLFPLRCRAVGGELSMELTVSVAYVLDGVVSGPNFFFLLLRVCRSLRFRLSVSFVWDFLMASISSFNASSSSNAWSCGSRRVFSEWRILAETNGPATRKSRICARYAVGPFGRPSIHPFKLANALISRYIVQRKTSLVLAQLAWALVVGASAKRARCMCWDAREGETVSVHDSKIKSAIARGVAWSRNAPSFSGSIPVALVGLFTAFRSPARAIR
mmetsp:Transcript_33863/g.54520  ORF Transcript_33863/g.54520 Transcript_33863/m.54520 type:complete len:250 (-) Transcript_33863:419-1168(-)